MLVNLIVGVYSHIGYVHTSNSPMRFVRRERAHIGKFFLIYAYFFQHGYNILEGYEDVLRFFIIVI